MKLEDIDRGKSFDWGRTSKEYAMYRDIYPDWNGCNDYKHDVWVPDEYKDFFNIKK